MNLEFIQHRIAELNSNRAVGQSGLSSTQVRTSQIKQRFTIGEAEFISTVADKMDTSRAVLSNALFINAIVDLLASDPELCDDVMAQWAMAGGEKLPFFDEIKARSGRSEPIEGEFQIMRK
ncbi:hypothetical protein SBX64_15930 [Vibrio rhizosphaerae]|uniref:Uncharacterized protein n=1 Tax=Vibrio rhizosphaerae TaxID=398736 RepID=A0ABU4IYN3_9VIBR|nr:hypothetical protein [Vibrio rhizosphaerae]MDW6094028.1 hypothetical protein [Vibrio rhizosphaerae]